MGKIKLIIISIIIFVLLFFIVNYKNIYYFVYKERAKDLVIEKMKKKYNIDISISKVLVGGSVFSYNPVCKVEFKDNNKKYYAVVDTMTGLDEVYDDYQYNEVRKYVSDYINKEMGVEYTKMELYYLGVPYVDSYNLNNLTNIYFDGNNINEIFKDGSIDLTYNVDVIDEEKISKIKKKFSKDIRWEFTYNNKIEEDKDFEAKEITCIYKRIFYDEKNVSKDEKYRLDFGKIRAYGEYEPLKGANIVKTEPFDISKANDYNQNNYKIISDFYRVSCSNRDFKMISFYIPIIVNKKKNYSLGERIINENGEEKYYISEKYYNDEEHSMVIHAECWNELNEFVFLERSDF